VLRSTVISEVEAFRYLGVVISKFGVLNQQVECVYQRAQVSALKTVSLMHQLSINSLHRHGVYFLSFVQAQFYGIELFSFSQQFLNQLECTRNLFMRNLFRLPPGTPSELFYVLWPSFTPAALCLSRRLSFFRRALSHDLECVTAAFLHDASLLARSHGWFYDSFLFYRSICSASRLEEFDFARDVSALLDLFSSRELFSFTFVRASTGPAMSFFRLIRHPDGLVKFRAQLSLLPNHHQHVILCFASSQMRWCFLATPRRVCPFCGQSWHWDHFFTCASVFPVLASRNLSLTKTRSDIYSSNWQVVFSDIAHVLLVWSFSLNADPNFVLSYDTDVFRSLVSS
jgi:hypothetical protein